MFEYNIEKHIELTLPKDSDAEEIYKAIDSNRNYLKKWLPWVEDSRTIEDARGFIEAANKQFESNNGFQAVIWYRGEFAGLIGYHGMDLENKSVSIGYWIKEELSGRGIMTKACNEMVDYAFNELRLNRVEIRCGRKNYKSRAIPERLGFTKEGIIREAEWLYDHYIDLVVYGILKREWKELK